MHFNKREKATGFCIIMSKDFHTFDLLGRTQNSRRMAVD